MRTDRGSGWCVVTELLTPAEITAVLSDCERLRNVADDQRHAGDKPHAGTHHLADLDARSELVQEITGRDRLHAAVSNFVDAGAAELRTSYRCPQPGYGAQKLHADGVPKLHPGPEQIATAIIALVDFTKRNGATRLIPGSHARPDLQRRAGSLDNHVDELILTGPAGTAFVFSGHLLHSGTKNASDLPRPALQLQWDVGGVLYG